MAEQAETHLSVDDNRAAALRIAWSAGERAGNRVGDDCVGLERVLRQRPAERSQGHDGERSRARERALSRTLPP